jgi:4-amino-4-deoxy-L-arabinose transferase-like glycosyltransferase
MTDCLITRIRICLCNWQTVASHKDFAFLRSPDAAVWAIIFAFLVARLVLAATLGFTVDESYTIANARDLNLAYFDHPPLHYWILHAFMRFLGEGHAARLPFVILFAGSSWLLYLLSRRLFDAWAGVYAVLALNLSAFFTVSAGCLIVPDGPLIFFLLTAALAVANELFSVKAAPSPWRIWILAGVSVGFAALSKYQAILFGFSILLYPVSVPARRHVFLQPAPWVGAAIATVMFAPVLIWNAQHDWVSFKYQGGRGLTQGGLHIGNALVNAAGQTLYLSLWVFVPMAIAVWQALRAGRTQERSWYCLWLGLPTIAFFTVIPLWGDKGLPHWSMSGWLMLYPILGNYLSRAARQAWPRRWAIASAVLFAAMLLIVVGHSVTGAGRLFLPAAFRFGDPTLEVVEWTPLRVELQSRGYLDRKDMFVIVPHWIDAGRIDQALGGALPVVVFGDTSEPKNFDFRYDPKLLVGRDALIIGRKITPGTESSVRQYFQFVKELPPFMFGRSGMQEIELRIMLAKKLLKPFPSYYAKRSE